MKKDVVTIILINRFQSRGDIATPKWVTNKTIRSHRYFWITTSFRFSNVVLKLGTTRTFSVSEVTIVTPVIK